MRGGRAGRRDTHAIAFRLVHKPALVAGVVETATTLVTGLPELAKATGLVLAAEAALLLA